MKEIFKKTVKDTGHAAFFKHSGRLLLKVFCLILESLCWIILLIPLALGVFICILLFEDYNHFIATGSSIAVIFLLGYFTRSYRKWLMNLCDKICDKLKNKLNKN
jgi:hypothetical protein